MCDSLNTFFSCGIRQIPERSLGSCHQTARGVHHSGTTPSHRIVTAHHFTIGHQGASARFDEAGIQIEGDHGFGEIQAGHRRTGHGHIEHGDHHTAVHRTNHITQLGCRVQGDAGMAIARELAPHAQMPHERCFGKNIVTVFGGHGLHARTCSRNTFFKILPAADSGSSVTKLKLRGHL